MAKVKNFDGGIGDKIGAFLGNESAKSNLDPTRVGQTMDLMKSLSQQLLHIKDSIEKIKKIESPMKGLGDKNLASLYKEVVKPIDKIEGLFKNIDVYIEKVENNPKLNSYKSTKKALEELDETNKEKAELDKSKKEDEKKAKQKRFRELAIKYQKQGKDALSEDEIEELSKLNKERKAGNFSEVNFDDNKDILKTKAALAQYLKDLVNNCGKFEETCKKVIENKDKFILKIIKPVKQWSESIGKIKSNYNKYLSDEKYGLDKASDKLESMRQEAEKELDLGDIKADQEDFDKTIEKLNVASSPFSGKDLSNEHDFIKLCTEYRKNPSEENADNLRKYMKEERKSHDNVIDKTLDLLKKTLFEKLRDSEIFDDKQLKRILSNSDAKRHLQKFLKSNGKEDKEYFEKILEKFDMKFDDIKDKLATIFEKDEDDFGFNEIEAKSEDNNKSSDDFWDFSVKNITNKLVINFGAHKVKDSEFGIVWEDKFGSLWSDNPDESPTATVVWESKDGKEEPTKEEKEKGDDEMSDETEDEFGFDDDEDLDTDTDTESSDEESSSEDDDFDIDFGDESEESENTDDDDFGFSEDEDESGDEDLDLDFGDEDFEEDESTSEESEGNPDMQKALNVISSMYDKLYELAKK